MIRNAKNKVKITGTVGDDSIVSSGSKVTIQAGAGDDTITGSDYGEQFWFSYASGKDVVTNFGLNDTLKCTSGSIASVKTVDDDVIVTLKKNATMGTVTLQGAAQYDFKKSGAYLTAIATINNNTNKKKISGSVLADRIINSGSNVTIQAGAGDDTITGSDYGEQFWFSYASGNDVITNFGLNDTLKCTAGSISSFKTINDDVVVTIKKSGQSDVGKITLQGAAQYNFKKSGAYLTAIATINNTQNKIKITGTSTADRIINSGSNVTIQASGGDDTITGSNNAELFLVNYSGGKDLITNFGVKDTLRATSGTLSAAKVSGANYIFTVKGASSSSVVTLKGAAANVLNINGSKAVLTNGKRIVNAKNKVKISGSDYNDSIVSSGDKVTIQAGKGADTLTGSDYGEQFWFSYASGKDVVTNFGLNDTLKCTSGSISSVKTVDNDVVVTLKKNSTVGTVTLQGAAQYDFRKSGAYLTAINRIENSKNKFKVSGTVNDDRIINYGSKVTIQAGAGNDTITGSDKYGARFQFSYASGADVITNFKAGDTLQSTSGTLSYKKSGNNYIVTIKKSGKTEVGTITLQNAAKNYTLKKNGAYITAKAKTNSNAQMPSDDYWFLNEESASTDELENLLNDAPQDNSIGKLTLNDPTDILTDNSARIEQSFNLATNARHKRKNRF